jgi:hypothetical protein
MYTDCCIYVDMLCVISFLPGCPCLLISAAWSQATHKETSPSVPSGMLKSGQIFSEATMDHGPTLSLIEEEELAYRRSFARHVASRTNKVCRNSALRLHPFSPSAHSFKFYKSIIVCRPSPIPFPSLKLVFCVLSEMFEILMLFFTGYVGKHFGASHGCAPCTCRAKRIVSATASPAHSHYFSAR